MIQGSLTTKSFNYVFKGEAVALKADPQGFSKQKLIKVHRVECVLSVC